jgi:uncharacterized RmlC-like cupin family protein
MSEQTVRLIRQSDLSSNTGQTAGMTRFAAVSASATGSEALFMGQTTAPAGMVSAAHHHGHSETAVYILRGVATFFFGEEMAERVEAHAGDFIFVPPYCVHTEANLGAEDVTFIVARSTQEAIVVNIDDIKAPALTGVGAM